MSSRINPRINLRTSRFEARDKHLGGLYSPQSLNPKPPVFVGPSYGAHVSRSSEDLVILHHSVLDEHNQWSFRL